MNMLLHGLLWRYEKVKPSRFGEVFDKVRVFLQENSNELIEACIEVECEPLADTTDILRECNAPRVYLGEGLA